MTSALTVFSALTTRTFGNARWICSARLSSLQTERVGGRPSEKSSGLATSMRTLPDRCSAPADSSAASEAVPAVQLRSASPVSAESAKEPSAAPSPAPRAHSTAAWLPAWREPIVTWWPSSTSFDAIEWPTAPVPSTPYLILALLVHHHSFHHVPGQGQDPRSGRARRRRRRLVPARGARAERGPGRRRRGPRRQRRARRRLVPPGSRL